MTLQTSKYWLQAENDRNTHNGALFIDIIREAFCVDEVVMVGHHFVFEPQEVMQKLDLTKLNEIPSADTVLFDHDIMGAVFGPVSGIVITQLAMLPVTNGQRDAKARELFDIRHDPCKVAVACGIEHTHA